MNPVIFTPPTGSSFAPIAACGICRVVHTSTRGGRRIEPDTDHVAAAEQCCRCQTIGCTNAQASGSTLCVTHTELVDTERRAARIAAIEWVAYDGGPVVWADRYFDDLDEALESGADPYTDLLHPAESYQPDVLDLVELIEEAWFGDLDNGDELELDADIAAALTAAEDAMRVGLPTFWRFDVARRYRAAAGLLPVDWALYAPADWPR